MLSEDCGWEAVEKSSVSEWCQRFKESSYVENTDEKDAYHFHRYEAYC
jgi:hypothetical protein